MRSMKLVSLFTLVAAVVVALDQWSKALTRTHIEAGERLGFIPGLIDLTHIHNRGAAFGMLQGYAVQLAIVAIVVVLALAFVVIARRKTSLVEVVAFGLIVGGAIGNLIDRISQGYVTDMIMTTFIDFPVFNVADSAVTVGTILFVIWALFFGIRDASEEVAVPEDVDESIVDG